MAINRAREQGLPAPSSYETKGLRRDGTVFDAEISASTYTIDGEVYPLVVIRDVSARKAAERALRETAERLSKVFNSTSDAQILHRVEPTGAWSWCRRTTPTARSAPPRSPACRPPSKGAIATTCWPSRG